MLSVSLVGFFLRLSSVFFKGPPVLALLCHVRVAGQLGTNFGETCGKACGCNIGRRFFPIFCAQVFCLHGLFCVSCVQIFDPESM